MLHLSRTNHVRYVPMYVSYVVASLQS
jgi:hypothetical protein